MSAGLRLAAAWQALFRASPENPSTNLANPASWIVEWATGESTASGVRVSPASALQTTAVLGAVRVIAESVASLPCRVYERQGRGKKRADAHPLYRVLHDQANSEMESFVFREMSQAHLLLWGNAYSEIERDGAERIVGLWPLSPSGTEPVRVNGRLAYRTAIGTDQIVLRPDQVLHIRGFGVEGRKGTSLIGLSRQAVGLARATEEYGARFFGNDSRPGGFLEHPGKLSKDAHARIKETWESAHQGLSQAHRIAVLEEGMKFSAVSIPPEDAQFLETRKFQVSEIARIFRVPPHMIGDLEKATFSNIEHQSIEFVIHTLRPWLVRWEQSILRQLFAERERSRYFAEFAVDGLLRGDAAGRYGAYAVARQNGWLSANEIRELENMNPIEGGDVYLVPLNMVPADKQGGNDNGQA